MACPWETSAWGSTTRRVTSAFPARPSSTHTPSYSYALTEEISLDFGVGLNIAKSDDFFGDDNEYIDYSATASLPLGGVNFGIGIVGTNIDEDSCGRDCEARVLVTLSKDL